MVKMGVVQIKNIAHVVRFRDKFLEEMQVTSWYGRDRYVAEYSVNGKRARLVAYYSENIVTIWFEPELLIAILNAILSNGEYLRRAVIIGVLNLSVKGPVRGFIDARWGKVEILKVSRGLWLGTDGYSTFFTANLEGLAELVEILEGSP